MPDLWQNKKTPSAVVGGVFLMLNLIINSALQII